MFALLLLLLPQAEALPRYLHQKTGFCEFFLKAEPVELSDLVQAEVVEPDGDYLHTPPDLIRDHEVETGRLLAERLRQPVALIPRLTRMVAIPAVDGILFDSDGRAQSNFSLKTFMPSNGNGKSLNARLREVMRIARRSVRDNYSVASWNRIVRFSLPPKISESNCALECQTYVKIFGLETPRPVTIVIDYTRDPSALFRVRMKSNGPSSPEVFLTLEPTETGISLTHLMDGIRAQSFVKEYIFLGAHHLLRVSAEGYEMSEFCDSLGHSHRSIPAE